MATPEYCPNCGEPVPPRARVCPECGSDEKTGWSDDAVAQRAGVPDDSFDYDEFVEREFKETKRQVKPDGISWIHWCAAILLVLVFLGLLTSC
ncbi:MAG: zinc ribbon domain-containing protein [Verrucomicrobia bacterium]|nr:zinc ribbon domain-containing protein [Verrucomicrobiota bacterium]